MDSNGFYAWMRSMVGQPDAQSRITHSPIYFYDDPSSAVSGRAGANGSIVVNQAQPDEMGKTIRHESAHQLISPYTSTLASKNPTPEYQQGIQQALSSDPAYSLPFLLSPKKSAYSEGLAYGAEGTGNVPGVGPVLTNDFIQKALDTINNNAIVQKYRRLQGAGVK